MSEVIMLPLVASAKKLGISKATLYRRILDGSLKAKKIGHRTMIETSEIKRFIEQAPDWQPMRQR